MKFLILAIVYIHITAFDFDSWEKSTLESSKSAIDKSVKYKLQPRAATYTFKGTDYPGMIFNNRLVPAVVIGKRRYPACIHNGKTLRAKIEKEIIKCDFQYIKDIEYNKVLLGNHKPDNNAQVVKDTPAEKEINVEQQVNDTPVESTLGKGGINLGMEKDIFKIKKGTYIKVKSTSTINSSSLTLSEFELLESVHSITGEMIENGATMFCRHKLNEMAQVIEFFCDLLVSLDGYEIPINATIHKPNKEAGLAGKMDYQVSSIVADAAKQSMWSTAINGIKSVNPFAGEIADDAKSNIIQKNTKIPVMTLYPQNALARFN